MFDRERIDVALFRLGYGLVFVMMIAPLLIVISSSFTASGYLTFPPEEVSLKWYGQFLESERWMDGLKNSFITATGTMIFSTILGVAAAFGLQNRDSKRLELIIPVVLMPLLIPPVVIGVTLLIFLSKFDLQQTYLGIILAHSLWATPLVFFIMQAVFSRFDWQLKDAAMDLGASPRRAFLEVILPGIKHGVFASALVAFIISLQEFVMALFLSGSDTQTIPVLAWNALRNTLDPLVTVVSTLLILSVLLLLVPVAVSIGLDQLSRQL